MEYKHLLYSLHTDCCLLQQTKRHVKIYNKNKQVIYPLLKYIVIKEQTLNVNVHSFKKSWFIEHYERFQVKTCQTRWRIFFNNYLLHTEWPLNYLFELFPALAELALSRETWYFSQRWSKRTNHGISVYDILSRKSLQLHLCN